jgi:serine/threonine protein kinase
MKTTKTGITLRWSSPETGAFKKININSDVWCFGNILFYIFTGKIPYWEVDYKGL